MQKYTKLPKAGWAVAVLWLAFMAAQTPALAHTVSAPVITRADTPVNVGDDGIVCVGQAQCSEGHDVQYLLDFDDETQLEWSEAKAFTDTACARHAWQASGSYQVRAMARCSQDVGVTSEWSLAATVNVKCTSCGQDGSTTSAKDGGGGGCFIQTAKDAVSRRIIFLLRDTSFHAK